MSEDELLTLIEKHTKVKLMACRIVRDSSGKSKQVAFIDLQNEEQAQKCLENSDGLKVQIYRSRPPEKSGAEERTAFINDLKEGTTEQEIREKFETCGNIEEVRISKNLCYIQFEYKWSVDKAIYHNQGYNVQVAKSKEEISKESHKSGKNTLHITNLAYETTEKEL